MKVLAIFALCCLAMAFADDACPATCNEATLDFCADYIDASTFCYDDGGLITPKDVDDACKEVADNETLWESFKTSYPDAGDDCINFFKSYTCTGTFTILTPPCSGDNIELPCYTSCTAGYAACGLTADQADTACGLLASSGMFADKDVTTCYESFSAAGLVQISAALFVAMIALASLF